MVFVDRGGSYALGLDLDSSSESDYYVPHYDEWHATIPELQPTRKVRLVTDITVYQTHNVPTREKLNQLKSGEITEDQALPGHRSANAEPRKLSPMEFVEIYDRESEGQIAHGQINLTKPIGVQGDVNFMVVPSKEACENGVPTFIGSLDPETRRELFKCVGNGITSYSHNNTSMRDISFGVTYGNWKSIGAEGVVHAHISAHKVEMGQSQGVATERHVEDFAPDLQGLYTNNVAGILAANVMIDTVKLTEFGLKEISNDDEKILSSGAVTFTVRGTLGQILAQCGDELFPYLEGKMLQSSAQAIQLLKLHTGDERSELEIRELFCGAIVARQHPENRELTQFQIVTGLKMNDKTARGGIFTAQNIWVARRGTASIEESDRFHADTDAFIAEVKKYETPH